MRAVDTNVVVRLLTQDDLAQAARAAALIKREQVWVAKTVMLETGWVLRSLYGYKQKEVIAALRSFSGLKHVRLEDSHLIARALDWADAGMDFADALHVASMGPATSFVSFDEKLVARAKPFATVTTL